MTERKGRWRRAAESRRNKRVAGFPLLIGVLPLEQGCGATQLSIMLANFLTAKERENGAVVFWRKDTITHLNRILGCEEKSRLTIKGMDFFAYEENQMSRIMNEGYQFILWCFSSKEGAQWEEFLRCNRHLVIGNLTEWHQENLEKFVKENKDMGGFMQWKFVSVFGPKERYRELERRTGVKIERAPWCEDPFSIKREWFSFLEGLV